MLETLVDTYTAPQELAVSELLQVLGNEVGAEGEDESEQGGVGLAVNLNVIRRRRDVVRHIRQAVAADVWQWVEGIQRMLQEHLKGREVSFCDDITGVASKYRKNGCTNNQLFS